MSTYYCKHCGTEIDVTYNKEKYYCKECQKFVHIKELIASWTIDARVAQLTAMHSLMRNSNDESIYMAWINFMPDCATLDDFKDIAMEDEMYNECFNLFNKLIVKQGNRW